MLDKVIQNTWGKMFDKSKNEFNHLGQQIKLEFTNIVKMAPVYDSGSSLARELNEERVEILLANEALLERYVMKGPAEIHWQKKKISHFDLINKLLESSYLEELKRAATFLDKWDEEKIAAIVTSIDQSLPPNWQFYRIPASRKKLIIKLLHLRFKKIKELLDEGI